MSRSGRWLLSVMLVTVMLLSACTGKNENASNDEPKDTGGQKKIELRMMWWGSQLRHEKTLQVIELFENKYPHITIKPEYMSDGYWDKLNTVISGQNAPDLIQLGNNYPDYVARNTLLDLTPYLGNQLKLEGFDQAVIDSGKIDGKLYAVSLGSNVSGIIYNTALIKKAGMEPPPKDGWTWDEFEAYAKELVEKLGDGTYGFIDQSDYTHYLGHFVRQKGRALYADGKITFNSNDVIEWFTMWDRFRKAGLIPDAETTASYTEGPENSLFVEGKAAMKVIWSNQVNAYQNAMQDEIGITLLPEGGTHKGMWMQPSQFMSVNAKTAHPEEAALFIDFMVTDPEATMILGSERGIPGSATVRAALRETGTETEKKVYDYVDLAMNHIREMDREMPNIAEWTNALKLEAQKVAFGQSSIEAAAEEVVKSAERAIQKLQ